MPTGLFRYLFFRVLPALWLLWPGSVRAALPPGVRHYGLEAGLPQRSITALWQSQEGFLWVGTKQGLCRFDGNGFTMVGQATPIIHALAGDTAGHVWAGLETGVWRFDTRAGRSQLYEAPDAAGRTPADQRVLAVLVSRAGEVYLGTGSGWLLRHEADGEFRRLVCLPRGPGGSPTWIKALAEDRQGNLWLSTDRDGGVYRYRPGAETLKRYAAAPGTGNPLADRAYVAPVAVDGRGRVYGSFYSAGLQRYDEAADAFRSVSAPADAAPPAEGASTDFYPLLLCLDDHGRAWLSRQPGSLWRYDPRERVMTDVSVALREIGGEANCLSADARGGMWVGTANGLLHFAEDPALFTTLLARPAGTPPGERYSLRGLAELPDGRLLAGGYRGLLVVQPGEEPREVVDYGADGRSVRIHACAILPDSGGRGVWVGSEGQGLLWLDLRTERYRTFASVPDQRGAPVFRFARRLEADGYGNLWMGTYEGLYRFNIATRQFEHLADPRFPELAYLDVYALTRQGSQLWVGARQGLYVLDAASGLVRQRLRPGLVRPPVRTIWFEPDGLVAWLGTAGGLGRLDLAANQLRIYDERAGLSHAVVNAILPDGAGRLWVSTDNGLNVLVPASGQVQRFLVDDGLSAAEFNNGSALRMRDGALLFGSVNGITHVHPRPLSPVPLAPLLLTELSWYEGRTDQVRQRRFGLRPGQQLVLQPDDEFFSLRYALAEFTDPARHRFAYRLAGLETRWNHVGGAHLLRYPRLPAGTYALELRAAGADGRWQAARTVLRVQVLAPVYARWWFRVLVAVLVAAGLYALHRYRLARVRQTERLRSRLAADLHDDVGSLLSQISIQSGLLHEGIYGPEEQRLQLREVAEASRAAVRQLNDVVWSIDAHNDYLPNLLDRMRDYAFELLQPAGLDVRFSAEADLPTHRLPVLVRRNLYLIFKEALHNVLKHARARTVEVTLRLTGGRLVLEVVNDGPVAAPRPAHRRTTGHGLRNIRARAEAARGQASCEPLPEGGFRVRVSVPLPG